MSLLHSTHKKWSKFECSLKQLNHILLTNITSLATSEKKSSHCVGDSHIWHFVFAGKFPVKIDCCQKLFTLGKLGMGSFNNYVGEKRGVESPRLVMWQRVGTYISCKMSTIVHSRGGRGSKLGKLGSRSYWMTPIQEFQMKR